MTTSLTNIVLEHSSQIQPRVTHGQSQRNTHKAEDVAFCEVRAEHAPKPHTGVYAVFDGHGGKGAAVACCDGIGRTLLQLDDPDDEAIRNAFWNVDEALGLGGVTAGSTATVLLATESPGGGLRCTLAWVGDSTAVRIAMGAQDVDVLAATAPHLPSNEAEVKRMELEWAIREAVHNSLMWNYFELKMLSRQDLLVPTVDASASASISDQTAAVIQAHVRGTRYRAFLQQFRAVGQAAVEAGMANPTREETILLMRSLRREALMHAMMTNSSKVISKPGRGRTIRKQSIVTPRFGSNGGPVTVRATQAEGFSGSSQGLKERYNYGLSDTMMTRSIGDWDAARACVPDPEIMRFEVSSGAHERVVIASDGLWDVCTNEKAASIVRKAKSAADAAYKLAEYAWRTSHARFDRLKDDTTIVVVDLDCSLPGESPPQNKDAGCGCLLQ